MFTSAQLLILLNNITPIDGALKTIIQQLIENVSNTPVIINTTATLDFPSTPTSSVPSVTVVVTGAEPGDFVLVSGPTLINGAFFRGYVSATNEVTVLLHNTINAPFDLPSSQFKIKVIK